MNDPAGSRRRLRRLVFGFLLLAGCQVDYELSLGDVRQPSTSQANDAGSRRDAKSDEDGALGCTSDDACAGSVRHICDPDAHVCYECNSNSDCQERPGFPHCNPEKRECEGCTKDGECRDGTQCHSGVCSR